MQMRGFDRHGAGPEPSLAVLSGMIGNRLRRPHVSTLVAAGRVHGCARLRCDGRTPWRRHPAGDPQHRIASMTTQLTNACLQSHVGRIAPCSDVTIDL